MDEDQAFFESAVAMADRLVELAYRTTELYPGKKSQETQHEEQRNINRALAIRNKIQLRIDGESMLPPLRCIVDGNIIDKFPCTRRSLEGLAEEDADRILLALGYGFNPAARRMDKVVRIWHLWTFTRW